MNFFGNMREKPPNVSDSQPQKSAKAIFMMAFTNSVHVVVDCLIQRVGSLSSPKMCMLAIRGGRLDSEMVSPKKIFVA